MSILNKTLKTMQTSKLSGAVSVYEESQKKVTLSDFIKDNLAAVSVGCTGAFLLVLIVFLKLLQKARIAEENAKKSQLQAEQANAFEEDRKMALSKCMNGHIAKLIDVKNMEEVLMSVLR